MQVVTVLNQKGGVGKTSICHHLAGALAESGRRVLLVDNDPQASLTAGFLGLDGMLDLDPSRTIAAVYAGDAYPEKVITPTDFKGIDFVPGSEAAGSYNLADPHKLPRDAQVAIREFLREVEGYDLALIDCPPNLYNASWSALTASDHLIVPVQPEDYGAQGILAVRKSYDAVRAATNPRLNLLGYVISLYQAKRSIHSGYAESLLAHYGDELFATMVPQLADYSDAITARKPVTTYKPKSRAAKVIRELAAEFQARLAAAQAPAPLAEVA